MTKLRALLLAVAVSVAAFIGLAGPAAASTDFPPYADCASALSNGSGGTGRMACFDKYTPYGPIFQIFSNWGLYYAAPYTDGSPASLPNHLWYGSEWRPEWNCCPLGYASNGYTRAEAARMLKTWGYSMPNNSTSYRGTSNDPGLLSWWYYAAADTTLNVVWITR
jgi:hypothetical protein